MTNGFTETCGCWWTDVRLGSDEKGEKKTPCIIDMDRMTEEASN